MGDNVVNGDLNPDMRRRATGDPQLDEAVHQWLTWDKNPQTRAQMEALLQAGETAELRRRLCSRMTFGTAGLRAAMGAGFALINDLTIIQSTQGIYKYLSEYFPDLSSRGIVVGCDTRAQEESGCSSERLARLTAAVMLSKDIPVYLYSTYVPTPFVPYAVKKFGAAAGVMVTASHNRKEDNGYKVYWCNGAQISSPHDKEILRCIEESMEPWSDSCWNETLADSSPLRSDPLQEVSRSYMEEQTSFLCFHRELNVKSPLKFVHSSFHGVGHRYVQEAFLAFGFSPPIPVPEQRDPDPNFSTVRCPNPEEGESVLELSLRLAERENARIVLASDPDADRLAVAELSNGCGWKVFTGNELAALLGWWMLLNWKERHADSTDKVYMLATTVSSKILQAFSRIEGFHFEETLPGFKWIGKRMHELAKSGDEMIFAFEESIGFLCGSLIPDKDGVSASVVVAEMATYLQSKDLTLNQQLHNIYEIYGYHISKTSYVISNDPPTVQKIFSRIRNFDGEGSYPKTCRGYTISHVRDVTTGYDSSQPDKRCVLPVTKSSQMITFTLQNGIVATLRTSGTEPKIKYYTEFCAPPGKSDISSLEEELMKVTDCLVEEFLEPDKNNLIRRVT